MKKQLLLILLSLFSYVGFASHMLGGEITWEKTVNGQFIFELRLYKDCGMSSAGFGTTQTITGPNGAITVSLVSQLDISPICTGAGAISCGSLSGSGAVEMWTYRNDGMSGRPAPITLAGTPTAAGWDFTHSSCCMPSSVVNMNGPSSSAYYIKSTMFPGANVSSPYFTVTPNQILTAGNNTYSVRAESDNPQDSLYQTLVGFRTSATGIGAYSAGYSASSPFPSSATNASNGAVSIDGNSGLISYDVQTASNGLYALNVDVEQWRNGVLISRVNREFSVMYNSPSSSNDAPNTYIDTSIYSQVIKLSDFAYKAYVAVGDTLNFDINASDFGIDPVTFLAQNISFHAQGSSLDTSWSPAGTAYGATVKPVAPQVGYTKSLSNNIEFNWGITNAHANNPYHHFVFSMNDNQCPYPGIANISLTVVVQKALNISSDTVQVCAGDSVALNGYSKSGNYSWSPVAGLSDPTVASPMASPSASGYYYLTDPTTNEMDSVYVEVTTPAAFTLAQSGSHIKLTDANPATSTMWYYNGIPFSYPHDTLPILGYGDYWVKGAIGPCTLLSDTVNINAGSSFSVSDPSMGSYNGTNLPVAGSHGVTFALSQSASLQSVSIPGLVDLFAKKSTGYDLNLKIYDANQMELYTTDVTLQRPMDGLVTIPVNYTLSANTDYTIAISGDSAYTFSMLENISYPMTPFHNGITVKGSYEGGFAQFPTQPSSYLLPFSLNTDVQVVSLNENTSANFRVYPNPAANRFTIEGLSENSKIQILDVNGKLVSEVSTTDASIVIERGDLSAGLYFVKISDAIATSIQKVMFQ